MGARGPLNPWIWPWMLMLQWRRLLRLLRQPLGRSRLWLLGLLGVQGLPGRLRLRHP